MEGDLVSWYLVGLRWIGLVRYEDGRGTYRVGCVRPSWGSGGD